MKLYISEVSLLKASLCVTRSYVPACCYNYNKTQNLVIFDKKNLQTAECIYSMLKSPSSFISSSVVRTMNSFCPSPLFVHSPCGRGGCHFFWSNYSFIHLFICIFFLYFCSLWCLPLLSVNILTNWANFHLKKLYYVIN